jgi:acyl-CoA synthetase (AMP-forming)/AMP-acid ligase II
MTSTPAVTVRSHSRQIRLRSSQLGKKYHMSRLYGPVHRSLQDRFETRRLADNVETRVVLTEIPQVPESYEFTDDYLRDDAGKVRRSALRDERLAWLREGRPFRIMVTKSG